MSLPLLLFTAVPNTPQNSINHSTLCVHQTTLFPHSAQNLATEPCPAQRSSLCGTSASRIAVPPLSFPRLSSSDWLLWGCERGWGRFPRVFLVTGASQWVLSCLDPGRVNNEQRLTSRVGERARILGSTL